MRRFLAAAIVAAAAAVWCAVPAWAGYWYQKDNGIMQTSGIAMRDGLTYEFSSDGRSVTIDGLKNAEEGGTEGWIEENGNWYYLRDGVKVTNEWLYNGDEKYYVGADGARYTGWREVDGAFYDFDRKGRAAHDVVQYRDEHKYSLGSDGRATELPITPEEKMIYSDTTEWCEDTYLIYTLSQEKAETAARIKRIQPPSAQELLKRDWGISTKEECEAMIQSLMEAGKAESTQAGKAWDFSRAMLLCRMMQLTGWIDLEERIDRQLEIAPVIQSSFSSWSEFNDAYMEGFRAWNTDAAVGEYREAAYQTVKRSEGYYCDADWNRELKRTW